ncbi:hypothetical protein CWATWH8502_3338 [Crocosphaera watsonii WH 8502]|nr:hypothetical protein CWATWH8502_3338 [Crocosphaera watsonii WH 8502]
MGININNLLHETYTNLDRLDVQFLLHPKKTILSCPQVFTDKPSELFNKFSLFLEVYIRISRTHL